MSDTDPIEILGRIVGALVDDPDNVKISCTESATAAVIDIYVQADDVGILLGKKGTHAAALRTIFNTMYNKRKKRLYLQIEEHP